VLFRFLTREVRMLNERLLEALYLPVEKRVRGRLVDWRRSTRAKTGGR
jgi:hypothetical protein